MIWFLSCLTEQNTPQREEPETCLPAQAPLRRLNATQYQNAIHDLFSVQIPIEKLPPMTKGNDFRTWASANPLSPTTVESMMNAAEYVIETIDIESLSGCGIEDGLCLSSWTTQIAQKAYRRPLFPEELEQLNLFFSTGISPYEATRYNLMLIIQHPAFLYYDGLNTSAIPTKADSYQIASRLSFFLRNAPPDEELRLLAEQESLQDPSILHEQAQRLAQSTDTFHTLIEFHYDWLNLYLLDSLIKDPLLYPDFGVHTIEKMKEETQLFVTETLWMGTPTFETLLLSHRAWLHPDLYATYEDVPAENWDVVSLSEERLGILTRSAFLSAHASAASSSPVRRGAFILRELLCEELSPPPEVDMEIPPPTIALPTIRERLAAHSTDPSCSGCHMRIDPVGYAFEHFGSMGEWREEWEGGQSIEASGSLDNNDFHDATELLGWLATSPRAQRCYAKKWMEYALGRPLEESDTCMLNEIQNRFVESGGNIQKLLIDISTSDAFVYLPLEQP